MKSVPVLTALLLLPAASVWPFPHIEIPGVTHDGSQIATPAGKPEPAVLSDADLLSGFAVWKAGYRIVDMNDIDTSHGTADAMAYIQSKGIKITRLPPDSALKAARVLNDNSLFPIPNNDPGGQMRQDQGPVVYEFQFPCAMQEVTLTRAAVPPGNVHPAWVAVALDREGNELDHKGEPLLHYGMKKATKKLDTNGQSTQQALDAAQGAAAPAYGDLASKAMTYTLQTPGRRAIASVRLISSGTASPYLETGGKNENRTEGPWAAYSAVLLTRLKFADSPSDGDIKCPAPATPQRGA